MRCLFGGLLVLWAYTPLHAQTGAVEGYFTRDAAGRLGTSTVGATRESALLSLRVWLDDLSAIPMNDGHFRFEGVPVGRHAVRAKATYEGQVHRARGTVTVTEGATAAPTASEVSVEPAPRLAFQWTTLNCRWGVASGFYLGCAVINRKGLRPTDPSLVITTYCAGNGLQTWTGRPVVATEMGTFEDGTVTATLGDATIRADLVSGGIIPSAERLRCTVNMDVEPNPVVIGQPATFRWSYATSDTAAPGVGCWVRISDVMYGGIPTLTLYPRPTWFEDVQVYYPRKEWVLSGEETARFSPGVTYYLTTIAADGLDYGTIRQRARAALTFQAVNPGEVPPPLGTALQTALPVVNGCLDAFVYYAEPPGPRPIANSLVVTANVVPHLVPAVEATVARRNAAVVTGWEGHLHLDGVQPGPLSLTVAAENPTTGELFTQALSLQLVSLADYQTTDANGTVIAYLYGDGGWPIVSNRPKAGTPLFSGRLIVDGIPQNPGALQNILAGADGRLQATLAPGPHRLRFEAVRAGTIWAAEQNVSVVAGTVTTVATPLASSGPAGVLNILGAQKAGNYGMDGDSTLRLRGVAADGTFFYYSPDPKWNQGNPGLLTYGPTTRTGDDSRKIVDGWVWLGMPTGWPGEWDVYGDWLEPGYFRYWPSREEFNVPGALLLETPKYTFPDRGAYIGNTPWIKTYPSPLIAGKPGVVYWGASTGAAGYWFHVQPDQGYDVPPPRDPPLGPAGNAFRGLNPASPMRVRALTREETANWLNPASPVGPFKLCVTAVDSQYYNCQRQRWLNTLGIQGVSFTTGKWLRLQGEHGSVKANGVPQDLPWAVQLDHGSQVALKAVPSRGYRFVGWSGQLDGSANPAELTVDGDKDVEAHFEAFPPALRWTDERGYKEDGVRPDAATSEQMFRFSVTYSSGDGSPPLDGRVKLRLQRFDVATDSWVNRPGLTLERGTGGCVAGREHYGRASLAAGKYRYRFVARSSGEGNPYVTGPPYQWTAGPVVNNRPVLEWAGTPDLVDQGVVPEKAAAGTTFRFAVRYRDADGDPPVQKRLHLQRVSGGGGWDTYRLPELRERRGTVEKGKLYAVRTTLPNGVYRYRFEMADYADAAGGPPARWQLGPVIENAPPILTWVGWQGYEADGVEPNTGGPGRYAFRANYADCEGNAPVSAEVVLKRPSGQETRHELNPGPKGSWARGRQLGVILDLHAPGQYEYRFVVRDRDGEARSFQAARGPHSGPLISPDGGGIAQAVGSSQITALVATQTGIGAQVSFSLSAAARVEARVLNIAGRSVANIGRDRSCEAGRNTLVWNAKNADGLLVPSGMYLVEVVARDDDGGQARALTQVRLSR